MSKVVRTDEPRSSNGPCRAKILVVDDVSATRLVIAAVLTAAHYEVTGAATGREALTKARGGGYDVIILDLGLPDRDGLRICQEIRTFSDAYVIIVSGRGSEADRLSGFAGGADDYVLKPFFPRELRVRVDAMMRRPREQATDELVAGDIRLLPSSREVSVHGRSVSLTKTEFTMLQLLVRRTGRIVKRQDLAEACWGTVWDAEDRRLTVHMANLRKKIDRTGDRLVTERGVGYRLVATPAKN